MKLTKKSRETLDAIRRQPARRTHEPGPGRPPWPHHPSTLAALLKHELVDHEVVRNGNGDYVERWVINDAGRKALLPPPSKPPKDTVTSLRVKGAATTLVMQRGVWVQARMPEPEDLTKHLDTRWDRLSRIRHEDARPTPRRRAA